MERAAPLGEDASLRPSADLEAPRTSPDDVSVLPVLSESEADVLRVLSGQGRRMTVGQLETFTGYTREELGMALGGLRAKGLVTQLNTVVESFTCRFPGLRVEGL
jgi:hypothetical protein